MKSEKQITWTAGGKARWMVVDDTDAVRDLIALLLNQFDCAEVCRFRSAPEALAAFAAAPEDYQFVITDYEMPGMNGIELCRELLNIAPRLKVLLATGSSTVASDFARSEGFCGLLNKPFPPSALRQIMEAVGVISRVEQEESNFLSFAPALMPA
jgi:CheY-like chemotaxis protein